MCTRANIYVPASISMRPPDFKHHKLANATTSALMCVGCKINGNSLCDRSVFGASAGRKYWTTEISRVFPKSGGVIVKP